MSNNKKDSLILYSLSQTLPDERPITSLQIIESVERCPRGFYPIHKTYDQDQDADLWREGGSFLKKKSVRYLCLSKSEGLPEFVVQELVVLQDKAIPPEGYSLLMRTADSQQKAWRKKQICYRLVNRRTTQLAVTDIIVCSRLKRAPEGFNLAGEINGVIVCYKMGNVQDTMQGDATNGNNTAPTPPQRPPKKSSLTYPSLNATTDSDHDYEILNPPPGFVPSRPAPKPPQAPPTNAASSTHNTLTSGHCGLEGVPFMLNPRFANPKNADRLQLPTIKARKMPQLMKEYDYDFRLERQNL